MFLNSACFPFQAKRTVTHLPVFRKLMLIPSADESMPNSQKLTLSQIHCQCSQLPNEKLHSAIII